MKKALIFSIAFLAVSCSLLQDRIPEDFDFGTTENGHYRNDFFDMDVHFDPTWKVQNQEQLNELIEIGTEQLAADDPYMKGVIEASKVKTAYLFTIFKYEVGAAVESNPSFMVLAENTAHAPGIKTGKDYLVQARKLMEQSQMGFVFQEGTEPIQVGDRTFDQMTATMDLGIMTLTQEYIVTVMNGFSLGVIITYTSEEEKAELHSILDKMEI